MTDLGPKHVLCHYFVGCMSFGARNSSLGQKGIKNGNRIMVNFLVKLRWCKNNVRE